MTATRRDGSKTHEPWRQPELFERRPIIWGPHCGTESTDVGVGVGPISSDSSRTLLDDVPILLDIVPIFSDVVPTFPDVSLISWGDGQEFRWNRPPISQVIPHNRIIDKTYLFQMTTNQNLKNLSELVTLTADNPRDEAFLKTIKDEVINPQVLTHRLTDGNETQDARLGLLCRSDRGTICHCQQNERIENELILASILKLKSLMLSRKEANRIVGNEASESKSYSARSGKGSKARETDQNSTDQESRLDRVENTVSAILEKLSTRKCVETSRETNIDEEESQLPWEVDVEEERSCPPYTY
nr:unnamed protein product [Callosobruchus analis]